MAGSFGDLLKQVGLAASDTPAPDASSPVAKPADVVEEPVTYGRKVVVRREKKVQGGKTITRVSGIASGLEPLAQRLKKQLGAGARVEDDTLVLHGDQRERVARWLESQGATVVRT